jgi:cytoskeletal protein CcmA (bactofilin family)
MKNMMKIASIFLLALLVFLPMQPTAAASGAFDGQVVFGQSFTLKSGETMKGDLLVFGGSATIENGATINGNAVVMGGNLTIDGNVTGDAAVFGGTMKLSNSAHVSGNLSTVGSTLDRAEGAQVDGQIFNTATSWVGNGQNSSHPLVPMVIPPLPIVPPIKFEFQPLLSVANAFGQAFALAVLAMLVMLFLASHADRVAHAMIAQPFTAGGLGLLTVIVAPIAIVLSTVTIILIPVALIIILALIVAGVFGWIAIGYEIGQRFTKAIHQNWHPAFSAGLGVFTLTLVAKALTGIPVLNCVGWLVPFVLGLAALGAVLMTRFGTQTVNAPSDTTLVAPANPSGQNPA